MDVEHKHIEGLRNGSYKDFTWLYDKYAPRLFAFIVSLSHSKTIAADIVQESFIKIWINRKFVDSNQSFKSYLFTIARNQLLNELRKEINQTTPLHEIELSRNENISENDIEKELSLIEFRNILEAAKRKLTPRQRELFELNKEQGLTIAEISTQTSISEQSIRNQLSMALRRLREEMGDFYHFFSLFFF